MIEIAINKLIFHDKKYYKILRSIPLHFFYRKDGSMIVERFNETKNWLESDHVIKTNTHFIFCEKIQDCEYEKI